MSSRGNDDITHFALLARSLANKSPAFRQGAIPGPVVTAIAATSSTVTPPLSRASWVVLCRCSWCSFPATSGTTPPVLGVESDYGLKLINHGIVIS